MFVYQYSDIYSVEPDEKVTDTRWQKFSDEELRALVDAFFNYESGEVSNETVRSLIRAILTESKSRVKE